jgi:hypothetical protein
MKRQPLRIACSYLYSILVGLSLVALSAVVGSSRLSSPNRWASWSQARALASLGSKSARPRWLQDRERRDRGEAARLPVQPNQRY